MSNIVNRLTTVWESRDAGLRAYMTSLGSAMRGLGRTGSQSLGDMNSKGSVLNNQLRAIGTTARYALAGQLVFGITAAIHAWGDYEAKLGEISSIASGGAGLPIVGKELDRLGQGLLHLSAQTGQPIEDLQAGITSLYSTIGDVPGNEAVNMMSTIAKVAMTSQSNIEDTTGALLGMLNAFKANRSELPKFGSEFYKVIKLSSGMPGHTFAQQLGRLSQSATLGGFTPEQMNALAVSATRFGGSASVNMRGLSQLLVSVMNPSSAKAEKAFETIGLGTEERQRLGGFGTLMRLLRIVHQRGVTARGGGRVRGLSEDAASTIEEQFGNEPTTAQAGLSGPGAELLTKVLTRLEGRRTAAALSQLLTPEQVAGTTNQTINKYLDLMLGKYGDIDEAQKRVLDRNAWVRQGKAIHAMGIEITDAWAPILNFEANKMTSLEGVVQRHQKAVGLGAGAVGIAALFSPLLRSSFRKLFPAAMIAEELGAGIGGSQVLGGSMAHPMHILGAVWIMGGKGPGGWMTGKTATTAAEAEAAAAAGGAAAGAGSRWGRLGRIGRKLKTGRFLIPEVGAALLLDQVLAGETGNRPVASSGWEHFWKGFHRKEGGLLGTGAFNMKRIRQDLKTQYWDTFKPEMMPYWNFTKRVGGGIGGAVGGLFGNLFGAEAAQAATMPGGRRMVNHPGRDRGRFQNVPAWTGGMGQNNYLPFIPGVATDPGAMFMGMKNVPPAISNLGKPQVMPVSGKLTGEFNIHVISTDAQGKTTVTEHRVHAPVELFPSFVPTAPTHRGNNRTPRRTPKKANR